MMVSNLDVMVLNSQHDRGGATKCDLLFVGHRRLSSVGDFTLTQHRLDVAALGL